MNYTTIYLYKLYELYNYTAYINLNRMKWVIHLVNWFNLNCYGDHYYCSSVHYPRYCYNEQYEVTINEQYEVYNNMTKGQYSIVEYSSVLCNTIEPSTAVYNSDRWKYTLVQCNKFLCNTINNTLDSYYTSSANSFFFNNNYY